MTKIKRYPSASGKRNLKDLYDEREIDHEMCRDVLSLVGEEADEAWTEEQRRHAANWAMRIYMHASDNPIERLAKPDFITLKGGMARTST